MGSARTELCAEEADNPWTLVHEPVVPSHFSSGQWIDLRISGGRDPAPLANFTKIYTIDS